MTDYSMANDYDPTAAAARFSAGAWQRSLRCEPNGGNCVEVNLGADGQVGVRDTKLANSPVFVFDSHEWDAFLAAVKAGQFDLG